MLPEVTEDSIIAVRSILTRNPGRWLMRLTALGNAVAGEAVSAQIETHRSSLVYSEGKTLYTHTFEPGTPRQEIEETVFQALRSLNQKAAGDGVMRDPLTGNVGSTDTGEFIAVLDSIEQTKEALSLEIVTERDIYSEGPLRVKCTLKKP